MPTHWIKGSEQAVVSGIKIAATLSDLLLAISTPVCMQDALSPPPTATAPLLLHNTKAPGLWSPLTSLLSKAVSVVLSLRTNPILVSYRVCVA